MSSLWFPDRKIVDGSHGLADTVYDDFYEANPTFGRTYARVDTIQLTVGAYRARVARADLEGIECCVEYKNQALQRIIKRPPDRYIFRVILETRGAHTNFGVKQPASVIFVQPPLSEITTINGIGNIVITFSVDRDDLLSHPVLLPEVADWLMQLDPRGAVIESNTAARRLVETSKEVFSLLSDGVTDYKLAFVREYAMQQLASAVSFSWMKSGQAPLLQQATTFERFSHVMGDFTSILSAAPEGEGPDFLVDAFPHLGSKRSIELAFKASVGMGPMQYWRLLRLHNVRRKLLQFESNSQTIGDIAAEEGFWDQSKFGRYYLRVFGERPSDTRKRLDPDVLSRFRPDTLNG